MKRMVKLVAGAVLFGIVSGAVFQGTNYVLSGYQKEENAAVESAAGQSGEEGVTKLSADSGNEIAGVSDVVESVLPSIVAIDVKVVSQQRDFFGRTYESEGEGSGSGIIIKEDSENIYMVTNNHVVEESVEVSITFSDDTTADASVVGRDASSDLAVVRVAKSALKEETLSNIKVAVLADSTRTKVGEQAIAIGNALGYGTSVTVGYVSARDREIDIETEEASAGKTMKLIQTDAAINPGNSGGALVNSSGEVIGINSSKFASEEVEGMGFAIPITDAVPIIEQLISSGSDAAEGAAAPEKDSKSSLHF